MKIKVLILTLLFSVFSWGQQTAVYTIASTTAVTTTGTAPSGSSATYSQTYTTAQQITSGNAATLTLDGYAGYKITSIVLFMKSNSSKGKGTLNVIAGSTTIASVSPTAGFNTASWYEAWSTSYVDVTKTPTAYTIANGETVTIVIAATENSLYIEKYTITYESAVTPPEVLVSATSLSGFNYLFGNGPSAEQSFTASGTDLTAGLVITAPTNYEVSTTSGSGFANAVTLTPTSGTVASTTIYTRLKSGLAVGTYNGTLTATSSGAPTKQITLSGSVSYSNSSDIIANTTYVYNSNIAYANYQAASITNTGQSVDVFKFDIRDGGGASDADALGTELNAITFNVTNNANIRSAALFNGNAMLNNAPVISGNTISFSGLSGSDFTAADNSSSSVTLRVTFKNTVTDNQQLQFTIASATANPSYSVFSFPNAGGASSSVTGDRNRIEVTADRLAFVQQPVNAAQNAAMGTAPTIKAADANGNIDFDYTTAIVITSTGTMTGAPITVVPTAGTGIATFAGIVHTSAGTYTLSAISGSLAGTTSNSFVISTFMFMSGDFRPLYTTDLANNAAWEYYNGSSWIAVPDGKSPQNTITTISRVLIDKYVTGGGSATKAYNCDFIIQSGGELKLLENDSPPIAAEMIAAGKKIEVLSGGKLTVEGDIDVATSTSNLIIRNGGTMTLDQASINNVHPMWDGIELFEGGSTVEIKNWDWTASAGKASLLNTPVQISNNSNGYKFGNLIIDVNTGTNDWALIGGPINVINLCENDLDISNASSTTYIQGATNKSGSNGFVVNGNMTIYDGNFSFGTSFTNDSFNHQFTINGDFECGSNDVLKIHHVGNATPMALNGTVTFKGDVKIASTVTSFANDGGSTTRMAVNFEGGTLESPKLIDIAPTATAIPMNIKSNAHRKLATHDVTTNSVTGYTAPFLVENNASLHFGWATNGTTPLVIKKVPSSAGTNTFTSQSGSTLISTSLEGLQKASASTGNVQYTSSNKNFDQTAVFWYVGKDNQVTGDIFTSGGTPKTIICDLIDNTKMLTLSNSTSISSPGLLQIKNGKFIESTTEYITGSTGGLTMEEGTLYSIAKNSSSSSDLIPRLEGLSSAYNLADNSTIELNGNDGPDAIDQNLRAVRHYKNLTFSNAGVKSISSGIANNVTASIVGTVTVKDAAILDVGSKSMGGNETNLTMTDFSKYRTGKVGANPQAGGTYSLGLNTIIEFYQSDGTATNNSTIRLVPIVNYANIVVNGPLVANSGTTTGVLFQSGGTFTVKNGATFKLLNDQGFYDGTAANTAIKNTNNPTITLEDGSTIEYIGGNQTISHFNQNTNPATQNYTNLKISGTGIKTLGSTNQIIVNENLDLKSSKLLLNVDEVITVKKAVIIDNDPLAEMELQNNAQLIQIDELDANFGTKFTTTRNYTATNIDYVYWSAPTKSFSSALLPNGARYGWDPVFPNTNGTFGNWIEPEPMMVAGKGYIARTLNGFSTPTTLPFTFNGQPNNGLINVAIERGSIQGLPTDPPLTYPIVGSAIKWDDNWNLVGNPYPSAINVLKFLSDVDNTVIEGFVHVWTHNTPPSDLIADPFYDNFVINYTSDDYVVYNGLGTVEGPIGFNGNIASGQSFFVMMEDGPAISSTISFKNSMRRNTVTNTVYDNSQFYRNASTTALIAGERNRIWLDIISAQNKIKRTLVGYIETATNEKDRIFDALTTPENMELYSFLDETDAQEYCIQGRALPFVVTDKVKLGINIPVAGAYKIAIGAVDGLFTDNQPIYLEDKLLDVIYDLRAAPYDFTSVDGKFDDRFVLRYTSSNLGGSDFNAANTVVVTTNENLININSQTENITHVQVFDLLGRQLYSNSSLNTLSHSIANLAKNQALIIKIKLNNGSLISKKIIVK